MLVSSLIIGGIIAAIYMMSAYSDSNNKTSTGERITAYDEKQAEEERRGEAVRLVVFQAYKGMIRRGAAIWRLSACVSHVDGVPVNVARFALEETGNDLNWHECGPIHEALAKLETI